MTKSKDKKILVIDDDAFMVAALEARLEANGYSVVSASDGEEGLQKAEDERPDLIVLDVVMPTMDGYTFIRELRKNSIIKQIPVIVLSGKDKLKDLFELEGINDFLLKPYQASDLLKKIEELLDKVKEFFK